MNIKQNIKAKVLIVDDNSFNRLVLKRILLKWKCVVMEAGNGVDAIEMIQANDIDIILMDLQMPKMDGLATTLRIRDLENPKLKGVPIIGVTAYNSVETIKEALSAGMDDCMFKPLVSEDLLHVLSKYLKGNEHNNFTELFSNLLESSGGSHERVCEYIDIFVKSIRSDEPEFIISLKNIDMGKIRRLVHKQKSSLLIMKMNHLAEQAARIEVLIDTKKDHLEVIELVKHYQIDMRRGIDELISFRNNL